MHTPSHPSVSQGESTLVTRAKLADKDAFAALVHIYTPRVYAFLTYRVRCRTDAEDLCQATFIRAWRSFSTFDPARLPLHAWLLMIASRLATNHLKSEAARQRHMRFSAHQRPTRLHVPGSSPTDPALDLWSLAQRVLDEHAASAIYLRYVEDLSPSQIAAALGRTSVGVRVLLLRARRTLELAARNSQPHPSPNFARSSALSSPIPQPAPITSSPRRSP